MYKAQNEKNSWPVPALRELLIDWWRWTPVHHLVLRSRNKACSTRKHGGASLASGNLRSCPPPHHHLHLRQQRLRLPHCSPRPRQPSFPGQPLSTSRFCRSRAELESGCCLPLPSTPQPGAPSSAHQAVQCPPHPAVCLHLCPVQSVFHTAAQGSPPGRQITSQPCPQPPVPACLTRKNLFLLTALRGFSPSYLPSFISRHHPITPSAPGSWALTVPHTHEQRTHLRTFAHTLTSAPNAPCPHPNILTAALLLR